MAVILKEEKNDHDDMTSSKTTLLSVSKDGNIQVETNRKNNCIFINKTFKSTWKPKKFLLLVLVTGLCD